MRALAAATLPFALTAALAQEPPTWDQLDAHPIPQWFQDAKFGIFIHWGVYSVPSYCHTSTYSEWYQHWLDTNSHDGFVTRFHERVYGKDFTYRDFAPQFRAELWDPTEWAKIFKRAGADYIVITSKHHDGFSLWPDAVGSAVRGYPWNAQAIGPRRDLLGELATAVRKEGVRFGLYYSFLEWHNPLFDTDKPAYVDQVVFPQVKDLIARYQPSVFWPDGEWEHPDTLWRSRELLHWLRENAPNRDELVVNDRWGKGCRGERGDYYTTEYGGYGGSKTYLGQKPFEECRGIGHSFAFNRAEGYDIYLSRTECVRTLIDLCSRGGKLLLDIGPDGDGTIPLIMVDRLLAIGDWLKVHGEAITGCDRSPFKQTPWGRATQKGSTVYLHVYDWPANGILAVPELGTDVLTARIVGEKGNLAWWRDGRDVRHVDLSGRHPHEHATVVALELAGPLRVQQRFVADQDGVITLPASAAQIVGKELRLEATGNLGFWTNVDDYLAFENVHLQPGAYSVEIEYALAPGEQGGEVHLEMGTPPYEFELTEPTKGWQDYRWLRSPVRYEVNADVPQEIRVFAKKLGKTAVCNLRTVRLVGDRPVAAVTPAVVDATKSARTELDRMQALFKAGDLAGVARCYADDAVIIGPGDHTIGRKAIDAYWTKMIGPIAWTLDLDSAVASGDLLIARGRSTLAVQRGTFLVDFDLTWRRQKDGGLRIVSDVYRTVRQ